MQTKASTRNAYLIPYVLWMVLFVVAPVLLVIYYSFFDVEGNFTFGNYAHFFTPVYLQMTLSSFWYAFLITAVLTADLLSDGLYADPNEAQAAVVAADYSAKLDQSFAKNVRLHRAVRNVRSDQSSLKWWVLVHSRFCSPISALCLSRCIFSFHS